MRLAYMMATVIVFTAMASAEAQEPGKSYPSQSNCLQQLNEVEAKYAPVRQHLEGPERRGLRTLKSGAVFLANADKEEACEEVVEGINEMYSSLESQLVSQDVLRPRDERQRLQRLQEAGKDIGKAQILRAGDLIGAEVNNLEGKDLGDVDDVIVHPSSGSASHLLVSSGGFLGIGEDFVAVPVGHIGFTEAMDVVVVNLTKEEFEKAPKVNRQQVEGPKRDDAWRKETDSYFKSVARG